MADASPSSRPRFRNLQPKRPIGTAPNDDPESGVYVEAHDSVTGNVVKERVCLRHHLQLRQISARRHHIDKVIREAFAGIRVSVWRTQAPRSSTTTSSLTRRTAQCS